MRKENNGTLKGQKNIIALLTALVIILATALGFTTLKLSQENYKNVSNNERIEALEKSLNKTEEESNTKDILLARQYWTVKKAMKEVPATMKLIFQERNEQSDKDLTKEYNKIFK